MFFGISTLFFLALFAIWSKKDMPNFFIKMAFLGMGVWGLVLSLVHAGFIVKA